MNREEIQQHIKDFIIGEIKEHKSNLVQVKGYIKKKFHKPLSSIDDAYIERKYVKYCSECWLQEVKDFLKRTTESKSSILIQEIFSSLDNVKSLSNIHNFFKQLKYYKLLIEHYKLISTDNEKNLISLFKRECLEQTFAYSDSAEKELVFLETFVDFLSYSVSLQSIIDELKLAEFCYGGLSFGEFLKGVIDLNLNTYGASLADLKETAKFLKEEEDLFLIDKFKEVIGTYIKPVDIQERKIDDRLVIEVIGKNVVVSEILCRLENKLLENANIEEVRFVGADIIHIDTNLKSEVWRGKNIAILAKAIKVHSEVDWNVSGKDNNNIYNSNAGTGRDGQGEKGKDGYPGESGGNVLILVEKIESPEKFTISSNGGKGSKGQDGGNGKNGEEGKGITTAEFYDRFPEVADTFFGSRNIRKTLRNIRNDSIAVKTEWHSGDNIFIETETSQGGGITFSYYERANLFEACQVFLLYKGSIGQAGRHAGEYGLGGQGGFAGEIIVSKVENTWQEFGIRIITNQGDVGEKGQGGINGSHGKNGWDMGYLDHQYWKNAVICDAGKYKVGYYSSNDRTPDSVWCGYNHMYADIRAAYTEHKKQIKYEERKNSRQNSDRQHHAQSVRKKNILQGSILAKYPHHLSSIKKCALQDLRSDLENTKQRAFQAIAENQEQQENQATELGIKRNAVRSNHQYKNNHRNDTIPVAIYKDTTNVDGLIDKLKDEPQLLDIWLQLRCIELTHSQLNDLFSNFEAVKTSFLEEHRGNLWWWWSVFFGQKRDIKNKLIDIEQLLIDKYRLASLQEITKQLPAYQEVVNNVELTLENTVRYLFEENEKGNNISHPTLGTLNQYLYENSKDQREKIATFCVEELQNSDGSRKILKRSLNRLFLEVGKSDEALPGIKKYYDQYKEFLEKQKRSLYILFDVFKSELSRPRHKQVFDLWIESNKNKSLRSELKENLQNDTFLYALYNRFNNQQKLKYDWDKCCKDLDILKEYNDYIREKGPLSESYRELLANVFDINIRLYAEDEEKGLSLQDNYNSSSKKTIHVLYRANAFVPLNINENYFRLEEECKKKDDLYGKILGEIEPLNQKQEFDDYLKNETFLADNALSEDKIYFEEEDIEQIIKYFTEEEKQQLKPRLEKITFQYIGQQGILHYILKRFSSEGKHLSYEELCYLINSILTSSIEERKEQNTFRWIVAAHSQRNWIDELILRQLENYFKRQLEEKSKWRKYLSKIENKNILLLFGIKLDQDDSISTQCIENTLHLLSNIPRETVSLEGLELSEWPYVLKEKYWLCKLVPLTNWQESEKLPIAAYYLLSIENMFGTDLVEKLVEALEKKTKRDIS